MVESMRRFAKGEDKDSTKAITKSEPNGGN